MVDIPGNPPPEKNVRGQRGSMSADKVVTAKITPEMVQPTNIIGIEMAMEKIDALEARVCNLESKLRHML